MANKTHNKHNDNLKLILDACMIYSRFLLLTLKVYRVSINAPLHVRRHKVGIWDSSLDKFYSFAARVWKVTQWACSLLSSAPVRRSGRSWVEESYWRRYVSSVVPWTSGTMSRQEKQKATGSFFTFRFRMKHRVRRSRRNCQESSKTSTENCAGNIKRVSVFIGPPRSAKLAPLWLALNSYEIQNKALLVLRFRESLTSWHYSVRP